MADERRYAVQARRDSETQRRDYAVTHMRANKAYRYAVERAGGDPEDRILAQHVERFTAYRNGWRGYPKYAIERRLHDQYYRTTGHPPLCVDIETAAACDLACPFCYRQWIATPDKLIQDDLYYRLIDQCTELGVPSVKLNWRGEPLLHPRLPAYVDYAKRGGILETLINTNAVTLTEEKARALIEAGLDMLIYSFDGGTKATYEKMRVGRFQTNTFEPVYDNIRRFARIRQTMGSPWPRTKIQMILTADTYGEQEEFFRLFSDCVDDVSVKAYTERGGELPDLDPATREQVEAFRREHAVPRHMPYWRDMHGQIFIATGRLACEQVYQRLMVTYDGSVSMCCYDWGNEHPIGYVDARAWTEAPADYAGVMDKARSGAKGFELLARIELPKRYSDPPRKVETLKEIWDGRILNRVRERHVEGHLEDLAICTACPFKETYRWETLNAAPVAKGEGS
jgi:MoaA/NifB/PqqE/SkfB family radical SAM enzyme